MRENEGSIMKTVILILAGLLSAAPTVIKDVRVWRDDNNPVPQGQIITVKAMVAFIHEACDEAPKKTSFYVKGARIEKMSDWNRIDQHSFSRDLSVKITDAEKGIVTVVLRVHENKETRQLVIPVKK